MPDLNLPILIPAFLTALGGAFAAIMTYRGKRDSDTASKVPSVEAIWARQDEESRARRRAESNLQTLLYVVLTYTARVQAGGSPDFTPDERQTIDSIRKVLE